MKIKVAARQSRLSQVQVQEVLNEIRQHHPAIEFECFYTQTKGDKDLRTSLRKLDKTNFFTKEIDDLVLSSKCRIGIHSAKDLPEPLPEGLAIAALTRGVDPSDSLVLRDGDSLSAGAKIATSSERREEAVKKLRSDLTFIDIRGTIEQRLAKLETGEVNGVVVAEAGLIRLGLMHLNRIQLPGSTVPCQGQLAIIIRQDDMDMHTLFEPVDTRKKVLHLGLTPNSSSPYRKVIHYPIIKIVPRTFDITNIHEFTHIIFTSKSAVQIFFDCLEKPSLIQNKNIIAVGRATAEKIQEYGISVDITAKQESSEGIIEKLKTLELRNAYLLWPHSALSRDLIPKFFAKENIKFQECILYNTVPNKPGPLPDFDEIIFTSPSTVDAFVKFFGELPKNKTLTPIGPVTSRKLHVIHTLTSDKI